MKIEFNPTLTIKQTKAWDHLEEPEVDEILFGGAKYGGKSWFLCVWAYIYSCLFAQKYKLPQSDHPLPIGFMGRKIAKHFSDTTLETWFKTIPPDGYVAKGNPVELIIDNRVKLYTGGLDNRELINKFNSAEFAIYCIDQAEETTEDDLSSLRAATFGRLVVNGRPIAGKGLLTANPAACWLKREFITAPTSNRRFVSALPIDNPYCTQRYIDNLKDSFKHRPQLLEAYLHGNWNILEGADQVIKAEWLRLAKSRNSDFWPQLRRFLVCDPARFGDDETVILQLRNTEIEDKAIMPYCPTTQISGRLASMSHIAGNIPIVVESTGADLGAGVVDELIEMGKDVIVFNPAAKSVEPDKYYNLRAEAWSSAAKMMASGLMDKEHNCVFVLQNNYDTLETQLCTPTYKWRKGRILIESKDDIKKRLGRSPDHADCYIIGLWALRMIDPQVEQRQRYRKKTSDVPSAMCM